MKTTLWLLMLILGVAIVAAPGITNCTTLTSSNTQYYLSNDIVAPDNQNCIIFSIAALNNSIDCLRHSISVKNASAITQPTGYSGIHQVKNCLLVNRQYGTIAGADYGIYAPYTGTVASSPTFKSNIITGFQSGIYVFVNSGSGNFGDIFDNTFINDTNSLEISTTRPIHIYDNYFYNNTYIIKSVSSNSKLYNNYFSGLNQIIGGGSASWNTTASNVENIVGTHAYGGNFWTNPTNTDYSNVCDDVNQDGYCDDPLSIGVGNIDQLPISVTGVIIANVTENQLPAPFVEFIGTDVAKEDFIFRASLQDAEGGNGYVAYNLLNFGEGGSNGITNSSVWNFIQFRKLSDLDGFSGSVCMAPNFSLTASPPGTLFGADGMLRIDMRDDTCVITQTFEPYAETGIAGNLSTQIIFKLNTSLPYGGYNTAQFFYRSSDGSILGTIIFSYMWGQTNITFFDGFNETLLYNGSVTFEDEYILDVDFDFSTQKIYFSVRSYSAPSTYWLNAVQEPFVFPGEDLSEIDFTTSYIEDVDSVGFSYDKIVTYPLYQFFATLNPNQRHSEDIRVPIENRTYAKYELFLWATDSEHGLGDYTEWAYTSFQYSTQTPALTDEQIANAVNAANTRDLSGRIAGDLFTDTIPSYLTSWGFVSVGSKLFVSVIVLILIAWLLVSTGAVITMLVEIVAIIALTYIGFIPAWVTAIVAIIAAALGAMALRKAYIGA